MRDTPREPTVDELLNDPIVRMLMERDGLPAEFVWACVRDARRKLKAREAEKRKITWE
jgi:hypothetical protein